MNITKAVVLGTMWVAVGVVGTFAVIHNMQGIVGLILFLGAVATIYYD